MTIWMVLVLPFASYANFPRAALLETYQQLAFCSQTLKRTPGLPILETGAGWTGGAVVGHTHGFVTRNAARDMLWACDRGQQLI